MHEIPNLGSAIVERSKLVDYLLNLQHPRGAAKALFFYRFGFRADAPEGLEAALRTQALGGSKAVVQTEFGLNYIVEGPLGTPSGRSPWVRSVWELRPEMPAPRLISAYPMEPPP